MGLEVYLIIHLVGELILELNSSRTCQNFLGVIQGKTSEAQEDWECWSDLSQRKHTYPPPHYFPGENQKQPTLRQ